MTAPAWTRACVLPAVLVWSAGCGQGARRPPGEAVTLAPAQKGSGGDIGAQAERIRRMEADLAGLLGADQERHAGIYEGLRQRARDGDAAAQTVQLVFGLKDSLREGCTSVVDRMSFVQQLDLLQIHLSKAQVADRVFAGPTLLLALQAAGRAAEQPVVAAQIVGWARQVFRQRPLRLGELLFEVTYALRLGCHLKLALPLLEEAAPLLAQGPLLQRGDGALLCRRDLGSLHFVLGDGKTAQTELNALRVDLQTADIGTADTASRLEVVGALLDHLTDDAQPEQGRAAVQRPLPRESGPGWQALRTVQQEASCPEATPANLHLVRVPVPPPSCVSGGAESK